MSYLNDENEMQKNAIEFGQKSDNIFTNVIGALDGWLVKIRPPKQSDGVNHPATYYCRKGYHAINVQVIVNKRKQVLWRSIKSIGKCHDSSAFQDTHLYKELIEMAEYLANKNLIFVGDSAYGIRSFLLVPYDNPKPYSKEDNFNYYLSSCRIYVECAFGEIDLIFGILWK